ncbi:MAG: CDP-glucose 4,6-dehydratase [Deltaproteobacteria bacterium HGW-Deltaproteobacteria-8]|jgi:CDP-glucose 4,6-dehydratase|nr:MAG: CDP-glucose 4,6-dehydratase [Deltaproteobacteria bacterium HGW-Deltaproteobacteria-8]
MQDNFFQGRRVFVTGHTGFKGAWLCHLLAHLGATVLGYSLDPPSTPSLFGLTGLDSGPETGPPKGQTNLHADILDLPQLTRAVAEFAPEIVIHMAAQSLVRPSYADPAGTFAVNVQGTVNVLEACRLAPAPEGLNRAIVVVTSDKCYENREWVHGYRECDPMGGHDPYSASKGCAELAAAAYARSFFPAEKHAEHRTAMATARAGNVIGGGDFATDRLVPDMARAFAKGEAVRIRRPEAVRPWQHVLEPLTGYLLLARRLLEGGPDAATFGGGWNFGPGPDDVRSVGQVAGRFATLWSDDARLDLDKGEHPHEAGLLVLDCSKARTLLGWQPRLGLDEALLWTCGWYHAWAKGDHDLRELVRARVREFVDHKKGA